MQPETGVDGKPNAAMSRAMSETGVGLYPSITSVPVGESFNEGACSAWQLDRLGSVQPSPVFGALFWSSLEPLELFGASIKLLTLFGALWSEN